MTRDLHAQALFYNLLRLVWPHNGVLLAAILHLLGLSRTRPPAPCSTSKRQYSMCRWDCCNKEVNILYYFVLLRGRVFPHAALNTAPPAGCNTAHACRVVTYPTSMIFLTCLNAAAERLAISACAVQHPPTALMLRPV